MDHADHPQSSQVPDVAPTAIPPPHPDSHHQPIPTLPRPLISTLGWDINSIVDSSPNFHLVKRVHYSSPMAKVDIVVSEVERNGLPLILCGWNRHPRWPKSMFNIDWLGKHGDQNPTVRNVHNWRDQKIPIDDFITKLRKTPAYASADEHERLYGKDIDCPAEWADWLANRDSIPDDFLFYGSNDFLKYLPDQAKVQTLMCYMGIGDTFTPFHKDLCASSGQNLMCFSEHSGSAFWFMTKSSAAPRVAAYFHQLGQEVDLETHIVTIDELARAPFDVYIAEQQLGDLVLVPPRSCHQVVNKGGITIKTSWSRMSLNGLQTALWHELPIYHRVCRQEIYKVKSTIFHALQHFTGLVEDLPEGSGTSTLLENLKQLVLLFDDILAAEVSVSRDSMPHISQSAVSHSDNLHCDFCGADIFQSFFECGLCLPASSSDTSAGVVPLGDGLILCPLCYVEGRTCHCAEMEPVQCRLFDDLLEIRDRAVRAIQRIDNDYASAHEYLSDQPLQLLSGQDANIFEAACKLFQKRQYGSKATRSCRVRHSHLVPAPAAIYCKLCHASECYTHLLELDSVHSMDALIHFDRYGGDANWHQYHRSSSRQYQEVQQRVIEDEENGSRPNTSHRLTYLAKNFTTCRAIAVEVTKHGWYDRFAQTTRIPILESPGKVLVGLSDDIDGDEVYSQTSDDTPLSKLTSRTTSGRGMYQDQPPRRSSLVAFPRARSPIAAMSTSSKLPASQRCSTVANGTQPEISNHASHSAPCSPSKAGPPPAVASLSYTLMDDYPDNLSDLTDLSAEPDLSPSSPSIAHLVPELADQQPMDVTPPSSPRVTSTTSLLVKRSQSKSRLIFDCVEIKPPEWHNGRKGKFSSYPLPKRKQRTGPLPSNVAESPNSDDLPLAIQETRGSLAKKKRKISQGPASRLQRPFKRTCPPLITRDQPPAHNILANALNQTFQFNGTGATLHVPTTPHSLDVIPPVNDAVISPVVRLQYRDIGVQKNPWTNFARNTSNTQFSEDTSTCILRLERENSDLRAQIETHKRDEESYRESLEEIQRRYVNGSPGSRHPHQPPPSGPSNFTPFPAQTLSAHPRWRTRSFRTERQFRPMEVQEPEYLPIETLPLPTPSSSESVSPTARRRTPTEPRSLRMRAHEDGQGQGYPVQPGPYFRAQHHGRRRGFSEPSGRGRRGRLGGPSSSGRSGKVVESSITPSSVTTSTTEVEVSYHSPTMDAAAAPDHDKADDLA